MMQSVKKKNVLCTFVTKEIVCVKLGEREW